MENAEYQDILQVWFAEAHRSKWFNSDEGFDNFLRERYEELWQRGLDGELDHWLNQADSCLALIILLDQIPLNIFRGSGRAFASERQAVAATRHAVEQAYDKEFQGAERMFFYMPLMHSEVMQDQDDSVALFTASGLADNARYARHHRDIVQRFGRFPHRNVLLGRESSAEEIAYLQSDEAFTG